MGRRLAGFSGTFVMAWTQTSVDDTPGAPLRDLRIGATWSWRGQAVRVDGPNTVMTLRPAQDQADISARASRVVRRMIAQKTMRPARLRDDFPDLPDMSFEVTDGYDSWVLSIVLARPGRQMLVMCDRALPRAGQELWVVRHTLRSDSMRGEPGAMICFTPGTMILTPEGPRDIASLVPGDRVQTQDNGPAPVLWLGRRHISSARLHALPKLAPIRLRAGALDREVPDAGLLVSPDHRIVLRGPRARALFNCEEVLAAARDLVDGRMIRRDTAVPDVTYIHMMLARHEIVFANNVATETFHPANAVLSDLTAQEQERLLALMPALADDPASYGGYARKVLSPAETAILRSDLGQCHAFGVAGQNWPA